MHYDDLAIILHIRPYGEAKLLVTVFTKHHGLHTSLAHFSKRAHSGGLYNPGNYVKLTWKSRLEEQLGFFTLELITPYPVYCFATPSKLAALQSACILCHDCLFPKEPHPSLFDNLLKVCELFFTKKSWVSSYLAFELFLLKETGFHLEYDRCAVTGSRDNITYVSPKSGRGVSKEAGTAYHDKLFPFPTFLRRDFDEEWTEVSLREAFYFTGYFLEKYLYIPHQKAFPPARQHVIKWLFKEYCEKE